MTADELLEFEALLVARRDREVDRLLVELHRTHHDEPRAHVRVHRAWIRFHLARGRYVRALGHAFAGYVVAAPASLVQRYTGLAVPAFKASAEGPSSRRGDRSSPSRRESASSARR